MSSGEQRQRVGDQAALSDWLQALLDATPPAGSAPGRFERDDIDFGRGELVAALRHHRVEDGERVCPYVVANLALAADGRPAADPHAAGTFEPGASVENAARAEVDAVLMGAGTLRSGRYTRALARPELRERRRDHGLARDPFGIVVTRSGELPDRLGIADDAESPVIVYTAITDPPFTAPPGVEVTSMPPSELTPAAALAHARRERGVRTVLYEGGTGMLGALLASDCLDDLFATVDDRLVPDPEQAPVSELPGVDRLGLQRADKDASGHATLLHLRAPAST